MGPAIGRLATNDYAKSGLRVIGFCPVGSTSKVAFTYRLYPRWVIVHDFNTMCKSRKKPVS